MNVMQVVDSLHLGGMEAVAVNLANSLSRHGIKSHICAMRKTGPLASRIGDGVRLIHLERKGVVDLVALQKMIRFIRACEIDLLHVHGSAIFFSVLAQFFYPKVKVIWHDHFGRYATEERAAWLYRRATRRVAGVIAVNDPLALWAKVRLRVPAERVWYLPNFVPAGTGGRLAGELPGAPGKRIVCVANLRPEKDHINLIAAMEQLLKSEPAATLLLVGSEANREHTSRVCAEIRLRSLADRVFVLGSRTDVPAILSACDLGVISSSSEGMPLALLEYGMAGLATVATRVGQVPEVLAEGLAGILVAPGQPTGLSQGMLTVLQSDQLRARLGRELNRRVQEKYSESAVIEKLLGIYAVSLDTPRTTQSPQPNRKTAAGLQPH